MRWGIDQPTIPLSPPEIVAVPWEKIDAPFEEFHIGQPFPHAYPDPPAPRPYVPGASTACAEFAPVAGHPADEVDLTPQLYNHHYSAGTTFAMGTLPDGLQYRVAAGRPDTSHLDETQKAGLLGKYSGMVMLQVLDGCPFPQFLPEQEWLTAGILEYYDPTNRGAIVLVGPVRGHVLTYRYQQADGQLDPTLHFFDFETATFT